MIIIKVVKKSSEIEQIKVSIIKQKKEIVNILISNTLLGIVFVCNIATIILTFLFFKDDS